ncbi:MAG: hypothetical protein LBH04_05925 [Tannerellaceae bacterium]|jgi:hypothetical protein|nr:hypothetical protein [Tannerellaceae bacterium]
MRTIVFLVIFLQFITSFGASAQNSGLASLDAGRLNVQAEGGILIGNSDNENRAPFVFHGFLNYSFWQNLSAGVGAGVEFYKGTHLPVMANVVYRFGSKNVTPFALLKAGYLIALENKDTYFYSPWSYSSYAYYYPAYREYLLESKGGVMIEPSVGIIVKVSEDLGLTFSAGYRHQTLWHELKVSEERFDLDYSRGIEYNRFLFKVGIIF